jgi:hypothetical protein
MSQFSGSRYYYDCDFHVWDDMLYPDAIKDRAKRAKELYFELLGTCDFKMSYEEQIRLGKVYKAWKDNEKLIDERSLII